MKVMAWNVRAAGKERIHDLASVARRERPDALALVEATASGTAALAEGLESDFVLAESNHVYPRSYGLCVAWVAGAGIHSAEKPRLPELAKALLGIEIDGIRLYATHLASRHEEQDHPREHEVAAIVEALPHGQHLLCGDFNAVAEGDAVGRPPDGVDLRGDAAPGAPRDALRLLRERGYVDCFRALHPHERGFTYSAAHPWLRLDYVFASAELAPALKGAGVVCDRLAAPASDHLPVWAEFA
jgi:exonuclease III